MATKPTSLPEWNSGGANRTTPPGGKLVLGYQFGEEPSSAYDNWWQNLVYTWVQYLNDAAFTTAVVNGNAATATGNGTGAGFVGTGGPTNGSGVKGIGVGTGPGLEGAGAATGLRSSRALNARSGDNVGAAATIAKGNILDSNILADLLAFSFSAPALYVRSDEANTPAASIVNGGSGEALRLRGQNGTGLSVQMQSGNGVAISAIGFGNGSGAAVQGGSTGYAFEIVSTNSTRAAFRWNTSTQPSGASLVGDTYMDSSGGMWSCIAAGTPGTWRRQGGTATLFSYTKASGSGATVSNTTVKTNLTGVAVTIAANRLRAGSRVRIKATFNTQLAAAATLAVFADFTGGVSASASAAAATAATNQNREFECELIVADNGTSAYVIGTQVLSTGVCDVVRSATASNVITNNTITLSSSITLQLSAQWSVANAANIVECLSCRVEVID